MTAVVEARDLTKRWGPVVALDGVTVDVGPGVTGLLGANGAGKTTLISLVLGLHEPDGGELRVLGRDPAHVGPEVRARIGYSPEHDALPPDVRAQDLVRHIAQLHGLPRRAAVSRASETLDLVGLGEERLREVGSMSVGQKQRVKLAQAIAHDPELVLLDEPTNGLDPLQRDDMLDTVRRIGHVLGIHVLVASHLIHEVERICDAVVVLVGGRLQVAGDVATMVSPGDRFLIEVEGEVAALEQRLAAAGLDPDGRGPQRLSLRIGAEGDLDTVRDIVAELGLGLRRFHLDRPTLEQQVFAPGTVT